MNNSWSFKPETRKSKEVEKTAAGAERDRLRYIGVEIKIRKES